MYEISKCIYGYELDESSFSDNIIFFRFFNDYFYSTIDIYFILNTNGKYEWEYYVNNSRGKDIRENISNDEKEAIIKTINELVKEHDIDIN